MNNRAAQEGWISLLIMVVIIAVALYFLLPSLPEYPADGQNESSSNETLLNNTNTTLPDELNKTSLRIANWNLQIFGTSKASNETLLNAYANIIDDYDIIFVQEIRDASGLAFNKLCDLLEEYECTNSSRAGRSTSKEQYGLIYRTGLDFISLTDYNQIGNESDNFERPPIAVVFEINGFVNGQHVPENLTIWNIHTKPEDVPNEMTNLEKLIDNKSEVNSEYIMILGDMNYACNYKDRAKGFFLNYHWLITDDMDTTSATNNCSYDRILVNDNLYKNVILSGIDSDKITSDMSDHYLIWTKFLW